MQVLLNILIALDQGLNCLWYIEGDGWGKPDEMISARVLRCYLADQITDTPMNLINWLFFWQLGQDGKRNHCERAWMTEVQRSQQPDHYRG